MECYPCLQIRRHISINRLEEELQATLSEAAEISARLNESISLDEEFDAAREETSHAHAAAIKEEGAAAETVVPNAHQSVTGGEQTTAVAVPVIVTQTYSDTGGKPAADDSRALEKTETIDAAVKDGAESGDVHGGGRGRRPGTAHTSSNNSPPATAKPPRTDVAGSIPRSKRSRRSSLGGDDDGRPSSSSAGTIGGVTTHHKRRRRSTLVQTSSSNGVPQRHTAESRATASEVTRGGTGGHPPVKPAIHPVFAKRERLMRKIKSHDAATALDTAHEVSALDDKIVVCERNLSTAFNTSKGVGVGSALTGRSELDKAVSGGGISDDEKIRLNERLATLVEKRRQAARKLDGTPLEIIIAAIEVKHAKS